MNHGSGMKAVTVPEPWASLVILGVTLLLTATRPTKHRGRLVIHAAADTRFGGRVITVAKARQLEDAALCRRAAL